MLIKFLDGTSREIANLAGANLTRANLTRANLTGADLTRADLADANLAGANLADANLTRADLAGANLYGANLAGADLAGANVAGANGLEQFTVCGEGTLIVYKKLQNNIIATLRIPEAATRINAYGSRKCRAAYAEVIALSDDATVGIGRHDATTRYVVGETVTPDSFDDDKRVECSHGIHFFITRAEAETY
jgi:uncharacterized protein YjbI with pentapeptide repeats